jgi:hypothetical protein
MVKASQRSYGTSRDNKVKTSPILVISFGLNLALAVTLGALRFQPPAASAPGPAATIVTRFVTNEVVSAPAADILAVTTRAFNWSMVESKDIRQYVANLRRIGCPEKTLRDLLLAEVGRHFEPKLEFNEVFYQPWQGRDRREADRRAREERNTAIREEKRALVRELLGFDWSTEMSEVWDREPSLIVFFGFLPDTKAQQVMALVDPRVGKAEEIRQRAGGILIDEDYAKLRAVRNDLGADLARLLSPAELDELEARAQLGLIFSKERIHLDGMDITGFEFREIMQASKHYKDFLSEEVFAREKRSKAEEASKLAEFEEAIAVKLGPVRLAEFKRAQDKDFQSTLAFTKKQKLAKEVAIKVYDARRSAEQQAAEIRADTSLSSDESAAALRFLQDTTAASVTSALGRVATNYFSGPGKWIDAISTTSAKKSNQPKGGRR